MLKSLKRVILFLFIITVVFVIGAYFYTKSHTYYNSDHETGNTQGNLYNGGLFSQKGNTIYFSNDYDGGSLYSMNIVCEDLKKISPDIGVYLNADNHYLYYVKAESNKENNSKTGMRFYNGGVYRMNNNGTGLKNITTNPSSHLTLSGNYLYYQQYSVEDGMNLERIKLDQTDSRILSHSSMTPITVNDNNLYYYDPSVNNIFTMSLNNFITQTKYKGSFQYPIFFEDYVYYINPMDKNRIYRMRKDGSKPTLLVNESCTNYNITNSGQYLYYQVGNGKSNQIKRVNLTTMKKEPLVKGSYQNIYVTDNYVFFNNIAHTKIFKVIADGGDDVTELIPSKK